MILRSNNVKAGCIVSWFNALCSSIRITYKKESKNADYKT